MSIIKIKLPMDELEVLSDILSDGISTGIKDAEDYDVDAEVCDSLNRADKGMEHDVAEVTLSEKDIQALFFYISKHNHLYSPIEGNLQDWFRYCKIGR